jgi:hypothetical protein
MIDPQLLFFLHGGRKKGHCPDGFALSGLTRDASPVREAEAGIRGEFSSGKHPNRRRKKRIDDFDMPLF